MYLWGPSKSYVRNPWYKHAQFPQYDEEPEYFDDGMRAFARTFREMNRGTPNRRASSGRAGVPPRGTATTSSQQN